MNTAPLIANQQGFEESPFEASGFRARTWPSYLGHGTEHSAFSRHRLQPLFAPGNIDPFSSSRWQRFKPDETLRAPASAFADGLRLLSVPDRVGFSAKLRQRVIELLGLEPGWDGESALPPKLEVMAHTIGLILFLQAAQPEFQEPFLVPTIGGFTQLEWHHGRRTLEFEATSKGWSIVGSETNSHGERVYHEADAARFEFNRLLAAYRWFAGTEAELIWLI